MHDHQDEPEPQGRVLLRVLLHLLLRLAVLNLVRQGIKA